MLFTVFSQPHCDASARPFSTFSWRKFLSFKSFSAAAAEATLSRIFAGVHFRSDLTSGQELGREVAHFVIDDFLTRIDRDDESDDN